MIFSLGKSQILSGTVNFPWCGSWVLSAMLDSRDPALIEGAPFALLVDNKTQMQGQVYRCVTVAERTRILCVPTGTSSLDAPCTPSAVGASTQSQIATTLLAATGNALPPVFGPGPDPSIESATLWLGTTRRRWLTERYNSVRFDPMSTPLLDAPDRATPTDHRLEDLSAQACTASWAFGDVDFWLLPGQIVQGMMRVRSSQVSLSQRPRIVTLMEFLP